MAEILIFSVANSCLICDEGDSEQGHGFPTGTARRSGDERQRTVDDVLAEGLSRREHPRLRSRVSVTSSDPMPPSVPVVPQSVTACVLRPPCPSLHPSPPSHLQKMISLERD